MPQTPPASAGKGAKYQNVIVTIVPGENVEPGDLCVFVRGMPNGINADNDVVKVSNPKHLNRRLCLITERGLAGQECKAITSGFVDPATLTFTRPLEFDEPLVATLAGTLTNDAQRGDRIIAYSRCEFERMTQPKTQGRVFFDGCTGFGAYQ